MLHYESNVVKSRLTLRRYIFLCSFVFTIKLDVDRGEP